MRCDLKSQHFQPDWDYKADTVDIQNVRLAHRKFLEHTSHLLIRYLDVSPTRSSLERLENIMRHPEISQGQRLLRVDLRYYRASMAEDSREFAQICHHKMQIGTRSLEIALKRSKEAQATPSTPRDGSPQAAMGEALSEDGVPEETLSEDDAPEDIPLEDIILSPAASEFITSGTSAQEFSLGYATWEDGALEDMFAKAQRILSSWGPLANGAAADEEGAHLDEAALALRRGHERYRALHLEQNELISDGRFVQAIAAAMASGHSRGQPSLWLCMSDDEGISHYHHNPSGSKKAMTPNYLADLDLLIQSHMIKPSPWFEHGPEEGEDAPQWLLYQLPLAMRAAGVALAGLKVQINSPFIFNLNMSQGQISGLREVAETLDIFEFHLEEEWSQGPDHQDSPGTLAGFYAYVSAAMGRQGVPILTFEVNPPGESCFELRPLFTSPSWQRLELAEFAGISMGIQDLRRLAGMLQPGVCLQLSSVNLTSGTWAAALDCLRSKARWGSYVADCRGAECDELDGEEYDSIFVVDLYGRLGSIGKATLYITSQIHKNPLRKDDVAIEATPEV